MSARIFGHYCPVEGIQLFALEALAMAAGVAALWALPDVRGAGARSAWGAAVAVLLAFETSLYLWDLHDVCAAAGDGRQGTRLLRALGGGAVFFAIACWIWPGRIDPHLALPAAALAALPALAVRWGYLAWFLEPSKVLLVGQGGRAAAVRRAIEREGSGRFSIAAQLGTEGLATLLERDDGRALSLPEVDFLIVASEERRGLPAKGLLAARLRGVAVLEAAQFVECLERRLPLDLARPGELAFAEGPRHTAAGLAMKRAFDIAAASLLLACAAPVMALAAAAIRFGSRGPILFRQERLGRDGKPYTLIKFRTMCADAEAGTGPVWAQERDPRVTPIGAFLRRSRLDELPQLFNVLGGSMSLVGPRPERAFFASHLREQIALFDLRLSAKPGVTGWAQLRYPYGASIEDARAKLELDLYSLKNWSPFLDLVIAFHTAKHVLLGRGAR